jgi:hypothetical protein
MTKNFPSDFYVTCATVIPVLYLALILDPLRGVDEAILRTARRAADRQPRRRRDNLTATLLPSAMYSFVPAGVAGEAIALFVLFSGSDTDGTRVFVLIMTLILLAAAAGGPTLRWRQIHRKATLVLRKNSRNQAEAAGQQDPADAEG